MTLLIHICCGPCAAYPVSTLADEGISLHGYFHNPNIHPFREFKKRLTAAKEFAALKNLPLDCDQEYGLVEYLRQVVHNEKNRCAICYAMRLKATAEKAKKMGVDGFTTTLLYSRYQKHELIRHTGEELAKEYGVPFYYRDFREGWQEGIDSSIEMGLYRQAYCGCIYSEQERYDKKLKKRLKAEG